MNISKINLCFYFVSVKNEIQISPEPGTERKSKINCEKNVSILDNSF